MSIWDGIGSFFGMGGGDMGPSANRYGGVTGNSGGTLTGVSNFLGGSDIASIGDALGGLGLTIGRFAKDPRRAAMFSQAADEWMNRRAAGKRSQQEILLGMAPQMLNIAKGLQGNPELYKRVAPVLGGYVDKVRTQIGQAEGDQLDAMLQAYAQMPPDPKEGFTLGAGQNRYDAAGNLVVKGPDADKPLTDVGQLKADLDAGRITQQQYDDAVFKATHFAPPASTSVRIENQPLDMVFDQHGVPVGTGQYGKDEAQRRAVSLFQEAVPDYRTANKLFDVLGNTEQQIAARIPVVGNFFNSEDYQRAHYAALNAVGNNLYGKSGAQLTTSEKADAEQKYIPMPGDHPGTIADKRARFRAMMMGAASRGNVKDAGKLLDEPLESGPAAPPPPAAAAAPTVDDLLKKYLQ